MTLRTSDKLVKFMVKTSSRSLSGGGPALAKGGRKIAAGPDRKTPRVLMVSPGPNVRGGITSVVNSLKTHPRWSRYSCTVLATCDDRGTLRKIGAGIKAFLRGPFALWGADIVHIHAAGHTSFMRKAVLFAFAKLMKRKVIVHLHVASMHWLFGSRILRTVAPRVLRSADRVIVLSPAWAGAVADKCPGARLVVIPNPVQPAGSRPERSSPRIVLFMGRLEQRKGYHDLIAAMQIVREKLPDATLVMAGHGELDNARRLAGRGSLKGAVTLLGWVDGAEKASALAQASVVCLPSYDEGLPMAVLEAMSVGVPVVCTPVGGIPDVIVDGTNGLLVTPGNVAEIAAALIRLLTNSDLNERMGRAGQQTVAEYCSLESVWNSLEDVYLELAAGK